MRNIRSAFTLVEVLIVVVVLGILAALVVPQFVDSGTAPAVQRSFVGVDSRSVEIERLPEGWRLVRIMESTTNIIVVEAERSDDGTLTRSVLRRYLAGPWYEERRFELPTELVSMPNR
jgi:prepilin-type N-terminal cleavage/methylation domain-containing protein